MKTIKHDISDEEFLIRYRTTAKPDDLALLYQRYMPMVYGVALKYLKDSDDAKDVVMQIFEELLDKALKHEIQVFRPWLYTCVRNYCLMEIRKKSRNSPVNPDDNFMEFCDNFNLDHIREQENTEKILVKCIEALPEKQRISIRRFFMEERSYREIEEATGFSLKMIKSFIQNGKRNLKLCLEKKGIR